MDDVAIGKLLVQARRAANLTQIEVAKAAQLAQSTVSALERGEIAVTDRTFAVLDCWKLSPHEVERVQMALEARRKHEEVRLLDARIIRQIVRLAGDPEMLKLASHMAETGRWTKEEAMVTLIRGQLEILPRLAQGEKGLKAEGESGKD